MKIISKSLLFLFLCSVSYISYGQESFGGEPYSFKYFVLSNNVPVIELPEIDNAALVAEDETSDKSGMYRIGVVHPVNYTMENSGVTDRLPGGGTVWRLALKSEGAYFTELSFSKFIIPDGAELYIYSADKSYVIGKFVSKSALEGDIFYTQAIPGDEVVIEYYEPQDASFHGTLELGKVTHGYRDVFKFSKTGESGSCHINVVCPEGDNWRDQIKSVVRISITTSTEAGLCSGAFINNARQDKKKYVYTAYHCYEGAPSGVDFKFYIDYQTDACNGTTGTTNLVVTGANIRARDVIYTNADFMLLEVTGGFGVYVRDRIFYAGWDRREAVPTIGAGIHHPQGDWKKISLPQSISSSGYYWSAYWRTTNNKGVTEQGSSGSPLFNASNLIVGTLSHGGSSCTEPGNRDNYGKFSYAWNNNNTTDNAKKLQPWLDPDNTGIQVLPGMYYSSGVEEYKENAVKALTIHPNPSTGNITVKEDFNAVSGQCKVYDMLGALVYDAPVTLSNNVSLDFNELKSGVYMLEMIVDKEVFRTKMLISK